MAGPPYTTLSPAGTPGKRYSFVAKGGAGGPNVKTWNGTTFANSKTFLGITAANTKTVNGVTTA